MKKILIVEDELVVRSIYRRKFELSGYQVETAEEGAAALKMLLDFRPDLIQLDIAMPGIGGVEVIRQIRAWPEFRGVHLLEGIEEYQKRERRYGGLAGDGASQHDRAEASRTRVSSPHASKTGRS